MKRIYALMALMMLAIISLNAVVLYLIMTRPSNTQVQRTIALAVKKASDEVKATVPRAAPLPAIPGEKGDTGKGGGPGPRGPSGRDGKSVAGPKGDPGTPGREVQLARDPGTGELYSRYIGDSAWTLIEAP